MWAPIALGLVGAAGWTAIPGLLVLASVMGVVGAGSAAGSVALARRADPLLEAGEGVGLLEGETFEPST